MFFSFFSSKNQKLVKEWVGEHKEIVVLAGKIIDDFDTGDIPATKKDLQKLHKVAINHIMTEDIELFTLLNEEKRFDEDTKVLVDNFSRSFIDTKLALIDFLTKYTKEDVELDEKFIRSFKELVGVLAERIEFEEKNLYSKMDAN